MNNRDFEKICNLLPAGYTWGCSLTPDVTLYIVNAALASQAQQTESQWISVKHQLPPRSTDVLVYPMLSAYSHVAWYDGDCWRVTEYEKYIGEVHTALSDGLITHWMPLPPAPEGDKP